MTNWATKEQFFKATVPREKITVPDLGDIYVWGLTSGEKDSYEDQVMKFNARNRQLSMVRARALLLRMTARNQHGTHLFGDEDMGRLQMIPAAIVDPILTVARRLSGMATGEIEDLVKNSEMAQAAAESD
jgi:hypothetical protein